MLALFRAALLGQGSVELDVGQGSAQLVGHVGHEIRLHTVQFFEVGDVVQKHVPQHLLAVLDEEGDGDTQIVATGLLDADLPSGDVRRPVQSLSHQRIQAGVGTHRQEILTSHLACSGVQQFRCSLVGQDDVTPSINNQQPIGHFLNDGFHLLPAALSGGEKARVLDGNGRLVADGLTEVDLFLGEMPLPATLPHLDVSDDPLPDRQGQVEYSVAPEFLQVGSNLPAHLRIGQADRQGLTIPQNLKDSRVLHRIDRAQVGYLLFLRSVGSDVFSDDSDSSFCFVPLADAGAGGINSQGHLFGYFVQHLTNMQGG